MERDTCAKLKDEFARPLHFDRPIAASLAAFKAARESTAQLLDRLKDSDWLREGTHAHDHANQIVRARASAVTRD